VDAMRLGRTRSASGSWGHRRASAWRVVGVVVVASLVALAASLSLLALPTSAFARTLSAEPAGGGFVENSDHTWTLYAYGHVIKVYSAAEKETIDRVWHAEEYDLTGVTVQVVAVRGFRGWQRGGGSRGRVRRVR
jgi:hypothetical protein